MSQPADDEPLRTIDLGSHSEDQFLSEKDEFSEIDSKGGVRGVTSGKRSDYLSWDEYFMATAFLSAQRSKDPRTQVGACIVNPENKIVGIGYNGMPIGCSDDLLPWSRSPENILESKQLYVCHAEMNAVLNKNSADVKDCRIYVVLFPCNECAKIVIQSGIKEVIYYSDKYADKDEFKASRRLLSMAGVKCRQYQPERRKIIIDFSVIERTSNVEKMQMLSLQN